MNRYPVPAIPQEIIDKVRHSVDSGMAMEGVIAEMRQLGLFITDSIKLIHRFYGISADQAKMAVHFSNTWADCRESNDTMHEAAFQAATKLGFEEMEQTPQPTNKRGVLQNSR
jgi:hypothetical protein